VLITNRKSYMSFRLVPKSVTLNDLPLFCVISPNSVASGAYCVKVVEDVIVKKFTFAVSSPDGFLVFFSKERLTGIGNGFFVQKRARCMQGGTLTRCLADG